MVRYVKNVRVHSAATAVSNNVLFEGFLRIEDYLLQRRLTFAGHCARSKQPIADLMLACTPRSRSGKKWTATMYYDRLAKAVIKVIPREELRFDKGQFFIPRANLQRCMLDRALWKEVVDHAVAQQVASRTPPEQNKKALATCARKPRATLVPYELLKDKGARRDGMLRKAVAARVCRHPKCGTKCTAHCLQCGELLTDHRNNLASPPLTCQLCGLHWSPSCPQGPACDEPRFEDHYTPALSGNAFLCNDCYGICRSQPMAPEDRARALAK